MIFLHEGALPQTTLGGLHIQLVTFFTYDESASRVQSFPASGPQGLYVTDKQMFKSCKIQSEWG